MASEKFTEEVLNKLPVENEFTEEVIKQLDASNHELVSLSLKTDELYRKVKQLAYRSYDIGDIKEKLLKMTDQEELKNTIEELVEEFKAANTFLREYRNEYTAITNVHKRVTWIDESLRTIRLKLNITDTIAKRIDELEDKLTDKK